MEEYDFMEIARKEIETMDNPLQVLDYWASVKMNLLCKIDSANWSINECTLRLETIKSDIILNTDFKGLYGKDNESIRKAHIQSQTNDLQQEINRLKHKKGVYTNQLSFIEETMSNLRLIIDVYERDYCECDCDCKNE